MANQSTEPDWTGVAPDITSIAPLTAETFVARLNRLSAMVNALREMRAAMDDTLTSANHAGRLPERTREASK